MDRPEPPVTHAAALAYVLSGAAAPAAVEEVLHEEFNADALSGGFAFAEPERFHIVGRDGTYEVRVPGPPDAWQGWIESFWARSRHTNRPIDVATLGPWQQAALAAVAAGSRTVRDLSDSARQQLATDRDVDYAEYVLILINRTLSRIHKDGEAAAIRAIAADDVLLEPPHDEAWTHPCPLCGLPSMGSRRYPHSVCDTCYPKTVDSTGRRITGYNASFGGGFEAAYVDSNGGSEGVCQEVTESGHCWIDGHECTIGEAKFGGVVVQAVEPQRLT